MNEIGNVIVGVAGAAATGAVMVIGTVIGWYVTQSAIESVSDWICELQEQPANTGNTNQA